MNAENFRRVAWKEYRALRGLWILLAAVSVPFQLLTYTARTAFDGPQASHPDELYAIALLLTALYALGASVILFAVEREEGTTDFLRGLPADSRGVFLPKVFVALAGLLALAATLIISTTALIAIVGMLRRLETDRLVALVSQFGLNPLEILAWGILFSLLSRRTIVAASLGVAAASLTLNFSARLIAPDAYLMRDLTPYAAAVFPYRLGFLALAVGLDVWLGRRWLRIMPLEDWLGAWRSRRELTIVVDVAAELREAQPSPSRWRSLPRLTWQAFRLGRVPMMALIGVSALIVLLLGSLNDAYDSPNDRTSWAGLFAAVIVALAGSCVFLADHQGQRYRFFSERPASPTALWLSRQLCWLTVVFVSILFGIAWWVFAVVSSREALIRPSESNHWGYPNVAIYTGTLGQLPVCLAFGLGTLLAFSAGQLCSMFFRSGILAAVFSVVLCGLFYAWVALQESFGVSWLLSVAPLTLIAFFVSWLRTRDWLNERTGPRAWVRTGLSVILPLAAMIAVLVYCRVALVPVVEPGFSLADYAAQATPEAGETNALYIRAGELVQQPQWHRLNAIQELKNKIINQHRADGDPAEEELAAMREQEAEFWRDVLEQNQPALAMFVQASARAHSAPNLSAPLYDTEGWRALEGERLLLKDAAILTRAGDLDTALARAVAALRADVHLGEHRIRDYRTVSQQDVMAQLIDWSIAPGQTPERMREAIAALATWQKSLPSPDDQLMALYERASHFLSADSEFATKDRWVDMFGTAPGLETMALRFFPWERARALRVLNVLTADDLRRSQQFFNVSSKALLRARIDWESDHDIGLWMRSTKLLHSISMDMRVRDRSWESRIVTEALVASMQIRLALVAWQIEHGELPEFLSDLVGSYFELLPLDPNTGEAFRYFPKGVQTELEWRNDGDPQLLPVGTPLLWSPGGMLAPDPNPANVSLRLYLPIRARAWGQRPEYGDALSEIQALQRGVIMPIPLPQGPIASSPEQ